MKLIEFIEESLVFPELKAVDKSEALSEMSDAILVLHQDIDESLYDLIMEREKVSSTGIGSGIAIPHAKSETCTKPIAAIGRSCAGIPFDAVDGKPVHLIFLIVGPEKDNETHLRILAKIAKFLHDTRFRDEVFSAEGAREILKAIQRKEEGYV